MSKISKFESNCGTCKFVTEFKIIGFRQMKNGKTRYTGRCLTCNRIKTVTITGRQTDD